MAKISKIHSWMDNKKYRDRTFFVAIFLPVFLSAYSLCVVLGIDVDTQPRILKGRLDLVSSSAKMMLMKKKHPPFCGFTFVRLFLAWSDLGHHDGYVLVVKTTYVVVECAIVEVHERVISLPTRFVQEVLPHAL